MTKELKDEFENDSFLSDINRILNMTNKEAAEVLGTMKVWMNGGRRNGKTRVPLAYNKAIEKAITALRKDVLYVCDQTRCENCSAKEGHCFMTSEITHAANFIDAGDGIYVEKTPAEWIPITTRPMTEEEEKDACEDYKHGIEHGLIPFGCSKLTESEKEE